jgi:hypothetical protein
MKREAPPKATAGNAGWASWFQLERLWPGVPESRRSGYGNALLAISAASAISAREKKERAEAQRTQRAGGEH